MERAEAGLAQLCPGEGARRPVDGRATQPIYTLDHSPPVHFPSGLCEMVQSQGRSVWRACPWVFSEGISRAYNGWAEMLTLSFQQGRSDARHLFPLPRSLLQPTLRRCTPHIDNPCRASVIQCPVHADDPQPWSSFLLLPPHAPGPLPLFSLLLPLPAFFLSPSYPVFPGLDVAL